MCMYIINMSLLYWTQITEWRPDTGYILFKMKEFFTALTAGNFPIWTCYSYELFNTVTVMFDLKFIHSFTSHKAKHLLKSIFNCPDVCVKLLPLITVLIMFLPYSGSLLFLNSTLKRLRRYGILVIHDFITCNRIDWWKISCIPLKASTCVEKIVIFITSYLEQSMFCATVSKKGPQIF